jgi:hypothetical protein
MFPLNVYLFAFGLFGLFSSLWVSLWLKVKTGCPDLCCNNICFYNSQDVLFYFYFEQPSFSRKVWPMEWAPIRMPMEEVAVHADHKGLKKADNNILLVVSDPQGRLDQQLRPHPIHLLLLLNIYSNII